MRPMVGVWKEKWVGAFMLLPNVAPNRDVIPLFPVTHRIR